MSRTASILSGVLLLLAANAASADTNSALDKLMSTAISQSQTMVALMTQSCPGDQHGRNPWHYAEFLDHSNKVEKTLDDIRIALAKGQASNASRQIDAAEALLEEMAGMMNLSCEGEQHGINPFHYGEMIAIKQKVVGSLDAVKTILAD